MILVMMSLKSIFMNTPWETRRIFALNPAGLLW